MNLPLPSALFLSRNSSARSDSACRSSWPACFSGCPNVEPPKKKAQEKHHFSMLDLPSMQLNQVNLRIADLLRLYKFKLHSTSRPSNKMAVGGIVQERDQKLPELEGATALVRRAVAKHRGLLLYLPCQGGKL